MSHVEFTKSPCRRVEFWVEGHREAYSVPKGPREQWDLSCGEGYTEGAARGE